MLHFFVSSKEETYEFDHDGAPLVFGREPGSELGPPRRLVRDRYVSGDQLRVTEVPGGKVSLDNLSGKVKASLADGTVIAPGASAVAALPVRLSVGTTLIEITAVDPQAPPETETLKTIARPVSLAAETLVRPLASLGPGTDAESLGRWLETVVAVQRSAAGSDGFYQEIAQAVVDLIGLDCGLFLVRKGDAWQTVARAAKPGVPALEASDSVLARVCNERQTFYDSGATAELAVSLAGVSTVVASPVLDSGGRSVLGVIYGVRLARAGAASPTVGPLHAHLVQVLASAAAAGIARSRLEAEAARRLVQFEQFFSRELADELDRRPELLAGQDRVVTVLFSDVRGFSRIAERVGPREACALMGDVFERLTARVHEHGGVVIDYMGDGLMALWNAPVAQPDHALRAARAALAMLGDLPDLNARWAGRLGSGLALGIGINSGEALVGNTGSPQRMKYGALGNTVNVASRVEGATKHLGLPALLTAATRDLAPVGIATRRLGTFQVVGIDAPVVLYELHSAADAADPAWLALRDAYESALTHYEAGRLPEACRALVPMLENQAGRHDKTTLALAARAIDGLRKDAAPFNPVITLDAK